MKRVGAVRQAPATAVPALRFAIARISQ